MAHGVTATPNKLPDSKVAPGASVVVMTFKSLRKNHRRKHVFPRRKLISR